MTKKDYELIARVICKQLDNGDNDQIDGIMGIENTARALSQAFAKDNERFDTNRFMQACKLEPLKKSPHTKMNIAMWGCKCEDCAALRNNQ